MTGVRSRVLAESIITDSDPVLSCYALPQVLGCVCVGGVGMPTHTHACTYMFESMQTCACLCGVWRTEVTLRCHSSSARQLVLRDRVFSLTWNWLIRLEWLAIESQRSCFLCILGQDYKCMPPCLAFFFFLFMRVLGLELRFLCLQSKHFTACAISTAAFAFCTM